MMNQITCGGRAVRDAESRMVGDRKVSNFTLAVDTRRKNPDGTYATMFYRVTAWGREADFVEKWVKKGSQMAVSGSLSESSYKGKDGTDKKALEIEMEHISFFFPAKSGETATAASVNTASATPPEDDLPF